MKTVALLFRRKENAFDAGYFSSLIGAFKNGGIDVDRIEILPSDDDLAFKRSLEEFRNTADNLIIVGGNTEFDAKSIIAEVMETEFIENENAKKFAETVLKSTRAEYLDEYALLPLEATVIPNLKGPFQGFMLEDNEFSLALLPSEINEIIPMCDGYVIPYFETKYGITHSRLTLKYFGDTEELKKVVSDARAYGGNCFDYAITTLHGDSALNLVSADRSDKRDFDAAVRQIVSRLKERIYAENDTTLGERLFDLLKLRKIKLSTAESFTGGRVVSAVIANSGASEFVDEGIVCYANESKSARLSVKKEDIDRVGAVSSQVAYQMAAGLLTSGRCELAISTTGIAGPNGGSTDKPVGLNYIGVGMKDGVHVYKYVFTGTREEITETAKNTALFLAINKLKNL